MSTDYVYFQNKDENKSEGRTVLYNIISFVATERDNNVTYREE